ncbi:MAG: MFS transporter [Alphaproteobacteria bacterium]|nr:MFS transporter [Alphaproteobacteria bacterium]
MDASIPASPKPVSTGLSFIYGLGSVASGVQLAIYALLLFFYNQVVGLSPGAVSVALAISLVLDAVWDPLVGHLSDNARTRWGRRHPFMYASAIPIVLTVVALWNPPAGLDSSGKFLWLLSFVVLSRLFLSLYEMPSAALAPELAPGYHDRTVLLSYRWVLGAFGGAVATSLGYFWFFRATPQYPVGQLNPAAWGPMSLTAAGIILFSILISAIGTHHRIATLHIPPARKASVGSNLRDIAATLKNWNLGVGLAASLIAGLSYGLYGGLALYFDTFFWGLKASQVGILNLANVVSTLFAAFAATALSRVLGKRNAQVILFFVCVVTIQSPFLLRLLGAFPENGSPVLLPMLMGFRFVGGVLTNAGFILMLSMIADITEEAQLKTGRRSEGLLMSAYTFVTKATGAISALLPAMVLALVHFPARAKPGSVDPAIVHHMAWVYLPVTSTLSFVSIAIWMLYRIDKNAHERNLASIAEAQGMAEAALERAEEAAPAPAPVRIAG